ncbi:MAG: hypothetical protein WC943_13035, partial [Elusimicrobiota bacterium]
GIFESANISVGRGTPYPFRWVGAPWFKAGEILKRLKAAKPAGVSFALQPYTPTKSVFTGQRCEGIRMTITDRDKLKPLEVFAHLAAALRDLNPEFAFRWDEAKRMVGTDSFKELYEAKAPAKKFIKLFDTGPKSFKSSRRPYLLYH